MSAAREPPTHRFVPGRRLPLALCLVTPLSVLHGPWPWLALFGDCALLVCAWLEARYLGARLPALTRLLPERMTLGGDNRVRLAVSNPSDLRLSGRIRDDAPEPFECTPAELAFTVSPHEQIELQYSVRAPRRGQYGFGALHVRVDGALGLGASIGRCEASAQVRVYPSLRGPQRYELAFRRGALHGVGIRTTRLPGGSGELDQLREYVAGDALRDLSWKASAKRLRPITRVHGLEQSQSVLIALDAGRLMAARVDALCKLDHAIHAALLLAWVALRAGDRVGLLVFEQQVSCFVPPARGPRQYKRLLESVYAVEASDAYVDFRALTSFVRSNVPRRSVLLMFSDLLDESQALPLAAELPKLRSKHLPVCVTLRDSATLELVDAQARSAEQVYLRAAAADVVAERALIKRQLERKGVQVIEAHAAALSVETVNRYLALKRRRSL